MFWFTCAGVYTGRKKFLFKIQHVDLNAQNLTYRCKPNTYLILEQLKILNNSTLKLQKLSLAYIGRKRLS